MTKRRSVERDLIRYRTENYWRTRSIGCCRTWEI